MKSLFRNSIVFLACVTLLGGCITAKKVESARAAFDRARASGAEAKAPSDYYMAEAYLDKARHETEEGDTKQARYFADQSSKYSGEAIRKAGGGAR